MEHSAGLLKALGWLDLRRKRALHSLVLMHKLLQGNGPEGLTQDLQCRVNMGTRTRGETRNNLIVNHNRTNYGKKIFFNKWTATWNRIPLSIRETTNSHNFKEKLHQYLISHHDFLQEWGPAIASCGRWMFWCWCSGRGCVWWCIIDDSRRKPVPTDQLEYTLRYPKVGRYKK